MNFRKIILLTIFLIPLSCQINDGNRDVKYDGDSINHYVEYYSSIPLRESPYPDFEGIIRISQEEALKRNHYRFTYDDTFRLVSVSFWLGNKLRNPNHTANYFFTAPMQSIQYEKDKEIITYFDRYGNRTKHRGAYQSIYSLDNNGRRIALHYEDENGEKIENSWNISDYVWEHQSDGSIIESRYDLLGNLKSLRPNFEFYRIRLYYEPNGLLALMQNIDQDGNLLENSSGVAQDKLLFDSQGRWLGWHVLDAEHELHRGNGPNVAKGISTSNEYGFETGIRYEDVDGSSIINSHGFWGSQRFYDEKGNYSYTYFLDSLGNPGINENTGYCFAYYTFDEGGYKRLRVQLSDVNKDPVLHKTRGYAVIEYEYDEFDNTIQVNYLGLDEEPINRMDNGVSYIKRSYDKKNQLQESKRYDKDGKLLE